MSNLAIPRYTAARRPVMSPTTTSPAAMINADQALLTARLDAERAYRDLSRYRITMSLEPDGWHIDYDLKNLNLNGGGPHYVIDATTGAIWTKRYEQ